MGVQTLLDDVTAQTIGAAGAKDFLGEASLRRRGQEAITRYVIVNRTTIAQPVSPVAGAAYLLPPTGSVTGADWAGALSATNDDLVFFNTNGVWEKATLFNGMCVFDAGDGEELLRVGGQWLEQRPKWTTFAASSHDGADLDVSRRIADKTRTLVIAGGAPLPHSAYSIAINTPAAGQTRFTFSPALPTDIEVAIHA